MMKPAREPASSRPKPFAFLKSPTNLARSPLLVALVGRKMTVVVRHQLYLRNFPVHAFGSRAKGFSPSLARR